MVCEKIWESVWFMRKSEKVKMECCFDVLWLFYYEMEDCNYCLVDEKVRERQELGL